MEAASVTNAFATGLKPVFKLTTQLGRSVRATANHKFLTVEGWRRLDELKPRDHVATPPIDRSNGFAQNAPIRAGKYAPFAQTGPIKVGNEVGWDQVVDIRPGWSSNAPVRFILKTADGRLGFRDVHTTGTNVPEAQRQRHAFGRAFLTRDPREVHHLVRAVEILFESFKGVQLGGSQSETEIGARRGESEPPLCAVRRRP